MVGFPVQVLRRTRARRPGLCARRVQAQSRSRIDCASAGISPASTCALLQLCASLSSPRLPGAVCAGRWKKGRSTESGEICRATCSCGFPNDLYVPRLPPRRASERDHAMAASCPSPTYFVTAACYRARSAPLLVCCCAPRPFRYVLISNLSGEGGRRPLTSCLTTFYAV